MFIIDLTLKNTPLSLSVQRKSAEEAQTVYQQVIDAIRSGNPQVIELTCDRQPDKKIGILSSEISAVQISEKTSATGTGRPPGFFSLLSETSS